ncbi:MAG: hypothetical protein BGO51_09225 [Rhodospirillales bacterium 69-11]|nr:MAG: hypothetical protein BGO51_09225 [Rhodospirillales bacterium 69-11]
MPVVAAELPLPVEVPPLAPMVPGFPAAPMELLPVPRPVPPMLLPDLWVPPAMLAAFPCTAPLLRAVPVVAIELESPVALAAPAREPVFIPAGLAVLPLP